MVHPFGRLRLIVNPRAGRRADAARVDELVTALHARDLEHDVHTTRGPGDATEAARQALADGCRYLVAVGGDGTVHEVVNGMFADSEPIAPDAVLGVVPAGSGSDFARTFGLHIPPSRLVRHLATDAVQPIDVGRVRYTGSDGAAAERLFVNIGEVGYGAEAVRKADHYPRWLGRVRYLLAAYGAIRAVRRPQTTVRLATNERTLPLVNLVVANAQFFGGGMKVAPRALPDDGRLNVLAFFGERSQVFTLTQRLYRGEHLPNPHIAEWQSPVVAVDPPVPLGVEADGQYLGATPAEFSLLPQALRLKI